MHTWKMHSDIYELLIDLSTRKQISYSVIRKIITRKPSWSSLERAWRKKQKKRKPHHLHRTFHKNRRRWLKARKLQRISSICFFFHSSRIHAHKYYCEKNNSAAKLTKNLIQNNEYIIWKNEWILLMGST